MSDTVSTSPDLDEALARLRALVSTDTASPSAPAIAADPQASSDVLMKPSKQLADVPSPSSYNPGGDYYARMAQSESGNNPYAKNPRSSASGTNQFLDGTFADMQQRHPDRSYTDKNDPRLMADFTNDNRVALKSALGRDPSVVDLKAAHILGAAGAVRFLSAAPNTPVTEVVDPAAITANREVFLDKAGNPRTVGQVYAGAQQALQGPGGPPMPAVNGNGNGFTNPGGSTKSGVPSTADLFPSADSLFGQQSKDVASYIASQPAMWAKLQGLQDEYKKQATPTTNDRLADAMSQFQLQQAAAQANLHANAGGVLLHSQPNADAFIGTLKDSHQIDLDARKARVDMAKSSYDMGSSNVLGQGQQQFQNLGLTGSLAKEMADYGLNTGKYAIELAKFGQDQVKAVSEYVEKMVPNPDTRARIMQGFTQYANPNAPLATNMKVIDGLIGQAQGRGMQIGAEGPKMFSVETFDPAANNGQGGQKTEVVNASTPEGKARLDEIGRTMPNAKVRDLGAQQVNVSNTNSSGGGGEGGGGLHQQSLVQQHSNAGNLRDTATAALELANYLKNHGGTGIATDGDLSKDAQNVIKQVFGLDPLRTDARQLYGKLMSSMQTQLSGPLMATMGPRPSQMEYMNIMKGQLGPQATTEAAIPFLQHTINTMNYTQQRLMDQGMAAQQARQQNNQYFDPDVWGMQYNVSKPPPQWSPDLKSLTTEAPAAPARVAPDAAPDGSTGVTPSGQKVIKRNGNWETAQ